MGNAVPPIRWKDPDSDFLSLKDALLAFIVAHGRSGFMPTEKDLRSEQRDDLVDAIEHFGGFSSVAERLELDVVQIKRKPSGYWDDLGNLAEELRSFNERYGTPGIMPRQSDLIARGRADIMNACQKHGGLTTVAQQLGLERFDPKKIKPDEENGAQPSAPALEAPSEVSKPARKASTKAAPAPAVEAPAPVASKARKPAAKTAPVAETPAVEAPAPAPAARRTRKAVSAPALEAALAPVAEAAAPKLAEVTPAAVAAPARPARKAAAKTAPVAEAPAAEVATPAPAARRTRKAAAEVAAPQAAAPAPVEVAAAAPEVPAPVEVAMGVADGNGAAEAQALPDLPAEERTGSGGFVDRTLTCRDCGTSFVFTASMQVHYAERGWTKEPQRCRACFQAHKEALQDRRGTEQRSGPTQQGGPGPNRRPSNNRGPEQRSGPPQQGYSHGRREPHQKPTYRTRCRRCGREMFTSGGTPYCTTCSDRQRRP